MLLAQIRLTDEELEDFDHGGGVDLGRIHEPQCRLICRGFFNAGMGKQDTIYRSSCAKGQSETRICMPSCNRGGGNQYAKGGGHIGPLALARRREICPLLICAASWAITDCSCAALFS